MIENFILKYEDSIKNLYKQFETAHNTSFIEFKESLKKILSEEYTRLISKNTSENEIYTLLFYKINENLKLNNINIVDDVNYICPGCLYFNKYSIMSCGDELRCNICQQLSIEASGAPGKLFSTFKVHSKVGFRCPDCDRFIPRSAMKDDSVVCVYPNCCFIGNLDNLKKMRHPSTKDKKDFVEEQSSFKTKLIPDNIENLFYLIDDIIYNIACQKNTLVNKHKIYAAYAFKNILIKDNDKFINYLINNSRSGGYQHKLFQEYVNLIDNSLPFFYQNNSGYSKIESLLDVNLGLFSGLSTFETTVNNFSIKNNTQEYYIGSRKGSYTKPYYIGKLLSITDSDGKSLLNKVVEYSFNKIKLKDVQSNTKVTVSHLRVPPHYQLGGMVYINRMRQSIIKYYEKK